MMICDLDLPRRITFPEDVPLTLAANILRDMDTDVNCHMNNTAYADLFVITFPKRYRSCIVCSHLLYARAS